MKKIGRAITVVFEAFFQIRGPRNGRPPSLAPCSRLRILERTAANLQGGGRWFEPASSTQKKRHFAGKPSRKSDE